MLVAAMSKISVPGFYDLQEMRGRMDILLSTHSKSVPVPVWWVDVHNFYHYKLKIHIVQQDIVLLRNIGMATETRE